MFYHPTLAELQADAHTFELRTVASRNAAERLLRRLPGEGVDTLGRGPAPAIGPLARSDS